MSKYPMKNFGLIIVLAVSAAFAGCQKQQTDEERRAEVDRQVQERLAAEHQQQQAQEFTQREAGLSAREQALKDQRDAAAAASVTSTPEPQIARDTTAEREPANSYSMFYTKLEPYGDWIETDDYGYVYRPREAENNRWRPYTNGKWVYTDAGWTWVSDEPFGWATYHYGRWTRIHGAGWVWVPGSEWAAAWVSWRKGGQYVGWAPLPPEAHFDRASGIHNWSDNYYDVGPDQYVFVSTPDFGEQRLDRAIVPAQQNITIVNQTTNVTNITYNNTTIVNQGPSYDELRAQSRTPIQRLRLQRETAIPAQNARAVVRGEVVAIPAPVIEPQRVQERPRAVKQTIKQATVDRGWGAVTNQREAEQARAKMNSEATPPPNAPSRKFVKAATASNSLGVPSATVAATAAPPRATPPPAATTAIPHTPQAPTNIPPRKFTPAPSATRPEINSVTTSPPAQPGPPRPRFTPLPANTAPAPAVSLPPTATTAPSTRSLPSVPPGISPSPPALHQNARSVSREFDSPAPSAAAEAAGSPASPTATSPTPSSTMTPPAGNQQRRGKKKRQLTPGERAGEGAVSPSATP